MTYNSHNAPQMNDLGWVKVHVERGPGTVSKGKWLLVATLPDGRVFERGYYYKHDVYKEVIVPSFDLVDVPTFLVERKS